ncbi:Abi family protein [Brucella sp. 10RB9213]|uniref:Abi family protein n=1 Tax=Brucella sp. 10RB9213 TaxID=1844039 RepID=UPI0012ADCC8E|nr:Abi family protein [Brucella sp. 10RB9213]MRN68010.1 hypothetical protein [Brucella sp. 10RB9213]
MSRYLSSTEIASISTLLSAPRLGTYLAITRSHTSEDAIELHQATMSLGIAIMAVTGLIEVSLRNAVCHELNNALQVNGWLRNPPRSLKWAALEVYAIKKAEQQARRAIYSKMTNAKKVALDALAFPNGVPAGIKHRKLAEKRQASINPVSDGQIIAHLTMHFWKRLFSENYEQTLWKRALKKIFPNKTLTRAIIASHLEAIYEARNRLAHHEPVYGSRLEAILESIDFVIRNFGSMKPSAETPLAKLILPQRDILSGQVAIFKATFDRLT